METEMKNSTDLEAGEEEVVAVGVPVVADSVARGEVNIILND